MTRDALPLVRLALCVLCVLVACGGESTDTPSSGSTGGVPDTTVHLLSFSRLQGYAEGIPCNADEPAPLAGAARLGEQLRADGDGVLLACVGDSLQHTAFVAKSRAAKQSAFARGRVVLDAMAAAGVDVYVPSHGDIGDDLGALLDDAEARGVPVLLSNVEYEGRDLPRYRIVEHDGLRIAVLGLIAPESADASSDPAMKVIKPARRTKALCEQIVADGLAHLIVAYSNLSGKANQTLCDAIDSLHFIVGSSDTGFKADRAVRRHGTTMLPLKTAGRELAQTTLRVAGDFAFVDLSQLHVLPGEIESQQQALAEFAERYGSDDPEVLAPLVEPSDPQHFLNKYDLLHENIEWLAQMSDYVGSSITHRRADYPPAVADDPVLAALREQGPAIERALAELAKEPKPLAEDSEVSVPGDCRECHRAQTEFWEGTAHATSHERLRDVGRAQDTHCQMCHVAAYPDRGGFDDPRRDAPFGGVTCFVCHIANRSHATVPRLAVDPTFVTADVARMTCDRCHTQRRTPGFDKETALPQVSCPPMRPDEPALAEAFRKALKSIENRRADGRATRRETYLEGRALVGLGRRDEGVELILRFADENTGNPELALEIARFLDDNRLSNDAIAMLSRCLQHMPGDPLVNQGLLQLLVEAKDPDARQPEEVLKRVPLLFPEGTQPDAESMPFRLLYVDALFALDRRTVGTQMLRNLDKAVPRNALILERMERYGIAP